jgi:hypothetical protein
MDVYHATTRAAAVSIYQSQEMHPGSGEMFGAGIDFADTPQSAQTKSLRKEGRFTIIIDPSVDFGMALVLETPCHGMNSAKLTQRRAQSVKGWSNPGHPWEFVAYQSDQI